jgi:hypothetical protein
MAFPRCLQSLAVCEGREGAHDHQVPAVDSWRLNPGVGPARQGGAQGGRPLSVRGNPEINSSRRFRSSVRETAQWKRHAADLEAEMLRRGMVFEPIDRSTESMTGPGS